MLQLTSALQFLNTQGRFHYELELKDILLDKERTELKISNLGCSSHENESKMSLDLRGILLDPEKMKHVIRKSGVYFWAKVIRECFLRKKSSGNSSENMEL